MSLPFGLWDGHDAFNKAQEFEEEQEEQFSEEETKPENEFLVRLSPAITSKIGKENKLEVSKLIICTDSVSCGFMDAYFSCQGARKIGLVCGNGSNDKEQNTVHQDALWDKTCFLYSMEKNEEVLVCQSKRKIDNRYMFDLVEKVFSRIDAKLVIILTSVPQCKLQIESNEFGNIDTLQQLKSEKFNLKTKIPVLEQPNLIRDLSAQVLSHCQVHGVAAVLYILATESFLFDVNAVKAFTPLLNEDSFQNIKQSTEDKTRSVLKRLCELKIDDKGVYI